VAARTYSQQQRDAIVAAFSQPRATAKRVSELAEAGELTGPNGEALERFTVPPSTVRHFRREAQLRRMDKPKAAGEQHDAVEKLRVRLVSVAREELEHEENKKPGARDLERIRQATRCVLEASKIPAPADLRAPSGTTRGDDGQPARDTTRDVAGPLLRAHRESPPSPTAPPSPAPAAGSPPPPEPTRVEESREAMRRRIEAFRANEEQQPEHVQSLKGDGTATRRTGRDALPQEDDSSCS
jgi:hypothetical protein